MMTVAGGHIAIILRRLGNMGNGEPSNTKGIKIILFTQTTEGNKICG